MKAIHHIAQYWQAKLEKERISIFAHKELIKLKLAIYNEASHQVLIDAVTKLKKMIAHPFMTQFKNQIHYLIHLKDKNLNVGDEKKADLLSSPGIKALALNVIETIEGQLPKGNESAPKACMSFKSFLLNKDINHSDLDIIHYAKTIHHYLDKHPKDKKNTYFQNLLASFVNQAIELYKGFLLENDYQKKPSRSNPTHVTFTTSNSKFIDFSGPNGLEKASLSKAPTLFNKSHEEQAAILLQKHNEMENAQYASLRTHFPNQPTLTSVWLDEKRKQLENEIKQLLNINCANQSIQNGFIQPAWNHRLRKINAGEALPYDGMFLKNFHDELMSNEELKTMSLQYEAILEHPTYQAYVRNEFNKISIEQDARNRKIQDELDANEERMAQNGVTLVSSLLSR